MAERSPVDIINPGFRVCVSGRRRVRGSGRHSRRFDDSSSDSDNHPSGFGENVQTLHNDKAYLLSKYGKTISFTRLFLVVSFQTCSLLLFSCQAEHETAANVEQMLRDSIPSDPDVPSYPNVQVVEERLAEMERRRAER